jgi:hypothetical protein
MYTLYTLSSTQDPTQIKYVGVTKQRISKRLCDHLYDAHRYHHPNNQWVRSVLDDGHRIMLTPVEVAIPTKELAHQLECAYIQLYKCRGYELTNRCDYASGRYPRTKEEVMKISKTLSGRKLTEQHRRRISEGLKRKKEKSSPPAILTNHDPIGKD